MPETADPTFYRSPADAIAAPPEKLAYVAAFDPAGHMHVGDPLQVAADLLDWPEESIALREAAVIHQETGESHHWAALLQRWGQPVVGRGSVHDMNPSPVTSFTAQVAEVSVDPETGEVRLLRLTTAHDVGRVLNPVDHQGQIEGAVVMGIGMALLEHTSYDPQNGAPINSNLADYVVAVNADAPPIDVHFLDFPDKEINEVGARGIGEIGLAGIAAAITDAVHHATGVRVRELPVKIENLLA